MDLHKIDEYEELAFKADTLVHRALQETLTKIRELIHEANDPNYKFAGGRIHRNAILCRNEELRQLRTELDDIKKAIATFNPGVQRDIENAINKYKDSKVKK